MSIFTSTVVLLTMEACSRTSRKARGPVRSRHELVSKQATINVSSILHCDRIAWARLASSLEGANGRTSEKRREVRTRYCTSARRRLVDLAGEYSCIGHIASRPHVWLEAGRCAGLRFKAAATQGS